MRSSFPLLFLLAGLLSFSLLFPSSDARMVGGWTPIKDPSNSYVVEIAQFAVFEHNKQGDKLVFVKVVRGETQVVAGTNYRLVIEASNGGGSASATGAADYYEAVVWDRPWTGTRQLTSFKSVNA